MPLGCTQDLKPLPLYNMLHVKLEIAMRGASAVAAMPESVLLSACQHTRSNQLVLLLQLLQLKG